MLTITDLSLQRGGVWLLENVNLTVQPGQRVAIVGANGAGKSSLFKLLLGQLAAEQGGVSLPGGCRIAHMAQEVEASARSARDFILDGDFELRRLERELAEAEARGDDHAIAHAHGELDLHEAWSAPRRAEALLRGLGFADSDAERPVSAFSGGWRIRLNLAQALMRPSDLLLLDEPTNHLDLDACLWLENWLRRYSGTLLFISHDRDFMDRVATHLVHFDQKKLVLYTGNYSAFEVQRSERLAQQQAGFERQQARIAEIQKFIDRFKAKASKAKQAQSRVKALERMEKIAPMLADAEFQFEFKEPASLPNPMLSMSGASFGYPPVPDAPAGTPPTVIVQNINRSVLAGQRIGILGVNGQGKSTLVKTIAGALQATAGEIITGKGLNIGYFSQQELDVVRPEETPLEHMIRLVRDTPAATRPSAMDCREQGLRNFLGTFNFNGDMVKQKVGSMSGGEKARLVLCMIVWQRPNLLLLDEPTNHLDLATREALSVALNEFEGSVMLVSHDRALLRSICDEFWLVSRGGMSDFDGDLDDYQVYLLDEAKRQRETAASARKAA